MPDLKHVIGLAWREKYQNLPISSRRNDAWGMASSKRHIAFLWESNSGGALGILRRSQLGRSTNPVRLSAQVGALNDILFNPLNEQQLATTGDDGSVKIWSLGDQDAVTAQFDRKTHKKSVAFAWHPTALGICASGGSEGRVVMWDLAAEEAVATVWESKEREYPQSVEFNYTGGLIVVATRERRLALVDPRALGTVTTAKAHVGPKGMRVCWTEGLAGKEKSLTTVGFDRKAQRELKFWDTRKLSDCVFCHPLHSGTRLPMCVWDDAVGVLVASGRGENVAKFFGIAADCFTSVMKDYRAPTPHHSFCFLPKHSVNVSKNEVLRLFRHDAKGTIQPVSFAPVGRTDRVPIPELYRHGANVPAAAHTSSDWRRGEDALPLRKDIFRDATGVPVVVALGEAPTPTKDATDTATGSASGSPRTHTQEPDHSSLIPSLHELLNEKPPQRCKSQSRVPELDFAKVRDRALQKSKGVPVFTVDGLTPQELGQVSVGSASLDWSYSQERYVARDRSSRCTPPPTPPSMKANIRVSPPTTDEAIPAGGPNDDGDTDFHEAAEATLPDCSKDPALTGVAEIQSAVSATAELLKRQIESLNSNIQGAKLSAEALMDYIEKCEGDLDALIDQKTKIDKLLVAFAVTPLSPV